MSSSGFLPGDLEDIVGGLLDDLRPGVVVLVDAVPEALQAALALLHRLDEVRDVLDHRSRSASAALPRSRRRGAARRGRPGRRGEASTGRRGLEPTTRIVVVEQFCSWSACRMNSTSIACASSGSASKRGSGDLVHHREEVLGEDERVVRVDERHAEAEAVGRGGDRRHLGDQPDDLLLADLRRRRCPSPRGRRSRERRPRDEHAHRVRVVVEPLHEALARSRGRRCGA